MRKFFISLILYSSIKTAFACTPGVAGGPTGDPNCMAPILNNDPYYNGSNRNSMNRQVKPKIIYLKKPDSWGAIVITKPDAKPAPSMSYITDQSDKRAAKKVAIKKCERNNKVPCVYVIAWANSCAAVSSGYDSAKKFAIFAKSADSREVAEKNALQECIARNYKECEITVPAQCSFPK